MLVNVYPQEMMNIWDRLIICDDGLEHTLMLEVLRMAHGTVKLGANLVKQLIETGGIAVGGNTSHAAMRIHRHLALYFIFFFFSMCALCVYVKLSKLLSVCKCGQTQGVLR